MLQSLTPGTQLVFSGLYSGDVILSPYFFKISRTTPLVQPNPSC